MKRNPLAATLCLWTIALPCMADTFTLKDGSVLEGTILKQEADTYVIEVNVTKTIKDERKIAKADVLKVVSAKPDELAFAAITDLVPTPDFLTADDYPEKIATVTRFLDQNKGSFKSKDARAMLETLKAEAAAISAGGIKLGGKVIPHSEYLANAYDIDARIQEAKIRKLVDEGELFEAVRTFAAFDRDYRTTLSYGSLAPFMVQVVRTYVAETKQLLLTLDARTKQREVGLDRMAVQDRKITEAAIKAEAAEIEARYQSEKKNTGVWVTTNPYHKASLEDTVRFGEQEITRLAPVKTTLGVDGGKCFRDAYAAAHGRGDAAALTAALTAAKAAMVAPRYLEPLEAMIKGPK